MQDRLEQPLAALIKRLRQEFPELISIYRFGSFGTEYEHPASISTSPYTLGHLCWSSSSGASPRT